jgi:hypothetical protein
MLLAGLLSITSTLNFILPSPAIKKDSTINRVWTYGAEFKLNFSFANSSPNWTSGANNNVTITGLTNALANLKKDRLSWDNQLRVNLGLVSNRERDIFGQTYWSNRKNLDNFLLDSKLGIDFEEYPTLSIYGGLNFQTQLLPGYVYTKDALGREVAKMTTSFLSQGQTQFALGTENKFLKTYYLRLGYVTLKQTYVLNQDLYRIRQQEVIARVQKGKFVDNEFGMQVQMGGSHDFGDDKRYSAKFNYLGFLPYQTYPAILDSRIDVGLSARLTKYFNLNYTLISIFDKDLVKPGTNAWQNSWVFGIAFGYHI